MAKKGKGIESADLIKSTEIEKEIKKHLGHEDDRSLWRDLNKLVTVVLLLSILIYGLLLFFAFTSVEDKGFFEYEPGKRFYAFSSCNFDKKIHCHYHTRINNVTMLHLENNYPFGIKIYNARTSHCVMLQNITVRGQGVFNLSMNCTSYNPRSSDLKITYINMESTLHHQASGKLTNYLEVTPLFKVLNDITGFFKDNADFVESSVSEIK